MGAYFEIILGDVVVKVLDADSGSSGGAVSFSTVSSMYRF